MTNLCICIKIHIPAIQLNYRFFNINREHNYFDESRIKNHVAEISSANLIPYLETIRNLCIESEGSFKVAVSISGIALKMLQKYAPEIIELLFELEQNNCIELLSEPWSNSLVPFVDEKLLIRQIGLHDTIVNSIFGKAPKVFIAHSPISTQKLFKTTINRGKKGIFSFLNPLGLTSLKSEDTNGNTHKTTNHIYLINHKISDLLHHINYNQNKKPITFSSQLYNKIKRNIPRINPLIVFYNPAFVNNSFRNYSPVIWKLVMEKLLEDSDIIFSFPDEIIHNYKHFSCEGNVSDNLCHQFKLPDYWLKNPLQTEAFKKQQRIHRLIKLTTEKSSIIKDWEIIQDKEFLYYMDNHFIQKKYRDTHFNPFTSPYLAYINYMNILDDLSERLRKIKTSFVKTQRVSII